MILEITKIFQDSPSINFHYGFIRNNASPALIDPPFNLLLFSDDLDWKEKAKIIIKNVSGNMSENNSGIMEEVDATSAPDSKLSVLIWNQLLFLLNQPDTNDDPNFIDSSLSQFVDDLNEILKMEPEPMKEKSDHSLPSLLVDLLWFTDQLDSLSDSGRENMIDLTVKLMVCLSILCTNKRLRLI